MVEPRRDELARPPASERYPNRGSDHGPTLAFANVLDRAPAGYFEVDARGVIVHANQSACSRLGIDVHSREPLAFTRYLPPRSIYPFFRLVRELLTTSQASSSELQIRAANGNTLWVRFDGTVLEDETTHESTCLLSMIDISKQRAADARLRASEQRLLSLIESIPDGIFVVRHGEIVFSNASAQRLVDANSRAGLVGMSVAELVSEEDRPLLDRCLALGDRPGPGIEPVEMRFRGRSGRHVLVETTWMSMVFEDTNCLLCVVRDLTERKEIQAQLAQADRLTTAGVLAAGVAHEINNPLTYIFLNLEDIAASVTELEQGGEPEPSALRHAVNRAMVGARRVRDIVKDLKSCTRDDETVENVSVNEVLEKTLDIARPQLRFKAHVETSFGDTPDVAANFGRLSQVFLNLIINASQALPESRSELGRIRITTRREGADVLITVQDTGCGIPSAARARLFEPFFTTKPVGEGSGLGLYICHQHLARYGGSIAVADDPDFRTTFVVRLPQVHVDDATQPRPREDTAPYGAGLVPRSRPRSLLVIDDDGIIRTGLQAVLVPRFGNIVAASSGNEAIELIRRGGRFDLILCDVLMGEGSGPDVHRWLETYRPDMLDRIAFITGGAYTDDARRFFADRELPCLEKPFTQQELASFVDRLLPRETGSGPHPMSVSEATDEVVGVDPRGRWNAVGGHRQASGA